MTAPKPEPSDEALGLVLLGTTGKYGAGGASAAANKEELQDQAWSTSLGQHALKQPLAAPGGSGSSFSPHHPAGHTMLSPAAHDLLSIHNLGRPPVDPAVNKRKAPLEWLPQPPPPPPPPARTHARSAMQPPAAPASQSQQQPAQSAASTRSPLRQPEPGSVAAAAAGVDAGVLQTVQVLVAEVMRQAGQMQLMSQQIEQLNSKVEMLQGQVLVQQRTLSARSDTKKRTRLSPFARFLADPKYNLRGNMHDAAQLWRSLSEVQKQCYFQNDSEDGDTAPVSRANKSARAASERQSQQK